VSAPALPSGLAIAPPAETTVEWPGVEPRRRAWTTNLATVALVLIFWSGFVLSGATGADLALLLLPSAAAGILSRTVHVASRDRRLLAVVLPAVLGECALVSAAALARHPLSLPAVAATSAGAMWVSLYSGAGHRLRLRYRARTRRAFVIGSDRDVSMFEREVAGHGGISLAGQERCPADAAPGADAAAIAARVTAARPTVVVISDRCLELPATATLAWRISVAGIKVRRLSDYYESEFGKVALASVPDTWLLFDVAEIHRRRLYGRAKRAMDLLVALTILVVAAPLMLAIAAWIKASSSGPVLAREARVGRRRTTFELLKFRKTGGSFLPDSRLDELPQLWNVVRGDLSLVGPRPERPQLVEEVESTMPFYAARHCVRPGMTGWAQVKYGYGGSELTARAKLELDLYYVKHHGLGLDFKVMLATVPALLTGEGA
jgi:lipopolysaccharide/colanic/teichoic acid biosynthesis glycosyltransferase